MISRQVEGPILKTIRLISKTNKLPKIAHKVTRVRVLLLLHILNLQAPTDDINTYGFHEFDDELYHDVYI